MSAKPVRRFTLLDAFVLVAATAAGLAAICCYVLPVEWDEFRRPEAGWAPRSLAALVSRALRFSQFFLAPWSLALLILRLRRPRPRLGRLVLQPGTVACIAAASGMALGAVQLLARASTLWFTAGYRIWVADPRDPDPRARSTLIHSLDIVYNFILNADLVAFGILLAWALLAPGRRGRPERSWLDRSGRILGLLWLAAALGGWYLERIEYFVQSNTPISIPALLPDSSPLPPSPPSR